MNELMALFHLYKPFWTLLLIEGTRIHDLIALRRALPDPYNNRLMKILLKRFCIYHVKS